MAENNNPAADAAVEIKSLGDILAYMRPDASYGARQIAKHLGVSAADVRRILSPAIHRGVVESRGVKRLVKYALVKERVALVPLKPLTISREMRIAMERCKELRIYPSNFGTGT
jgi:predicted transcriptional regulator